MTATPEQIAARSLEALREYARIGLALYTAATATIAMFHPEHSQTPLDRAIIEKEAGK